jgi:hypothetical protein
MVDERRDFAWWVVWFGGINFALHHADLASQRRQVLVLGGLSSLPAEQRRPWRTSIRSSLTPNSAGETCSLKCAIYSGQILWASPATTSGVIAPPFLDLIDQVIVEWSLPIVDSEDPAQEVSQEELHSAAVDQLNNLIKPFTEQTGKPVILSLLYMSANGGIGECLPDPQAISTDECLDAEDLARPNPDIPSVELDLNEQDQVYEAFLQAVQELGYLNGVISAGYYPSAALQDKSASVHGKPAGGEVSEWFQELTASP